MSQSITVLNMTKKIFVWVEESCKTTILNIGIYKYIMLYMTQMVIKAVALIIDLGYYYCIISHRLIILILIKFDVIMSAGSDTRSRTCPIFYNKDVFHL